MTFRPRKLEVQKSMFLLAWGQVGWTRSRKELLGDTNYPCYGLMVFLVFLLLWWHTVTKTTWGGEGLFCLHFYITVLHCGRSGWALKPSRKLQAEAHSEILEQCILLGAPRGLLRMFSYRTQDHKPLGSNMHNGLGFHTSITLQTRSQLRVSVPRWL